MEWVVEVPESERNSGKPTLSTAEAGYKALLEQGCVLLRGVFETATIDAMHGEYLEQYGKLGARQMAARAAEPGSNPIYEVGGGRYEITPRMNGAFGDPKVFANPFLRAFLAPLLGDTMRLSGLTVVVSHPGSELQHIHRDHPLLFGDCEESCQIPTYAVNVSVPLLDVDLDMGPTGVWLGSNQRFDGTNPKPDEMTVVPFQRGDCILIDYRTLHAGLPNESTVVRPIAYLVYTRTWFFDEINHVKRSPLGMTLDQYEALPENLKPLLLRGFTQHMRAKHVTGLTR